MGDQKCPSSASVEPDQGRGRLQHRGDPRNARLSWIGRLQFCHPDIQASDRQPRSIASVTRRRKLEGAQVKRSSNRSSGRKARTAKWRALEGASWRVAPVVGDGLSRDVLARSCSSCRNLRVAARVSRSKCSRWSVLVAATGDGAMGLGKDHPSIGSGTDLRIVARAPSS